MGHGKGVRSEAVRSEGVRSEGVMVTPGIVRGEEVGPSDTRWLAHERCVQAVKASYSAVVACLDHIYTDTHEPEALHLKKILCKKSTVAAIYLLDYVLPQLAKLSRALQTESLDLSVLFICLTLLYLP